MCPCGPSCFHDSHLELSARLLALLGLVPLRADPPDPGEPVLAAGGEEGAGPGPGQCQARHPVLGATQAVRQGVGRGGVGGGAR